MKNDVWWQQRPQLLEEELQALEAAGITYERDAEAFASGIARLRLRMKVNGDELRLVVTFPDLYPYFRFEVIAPDLNLSHHQNPFEKNLCLIGRGSDRWHTHFTVARLLQEQLPDALKGGREEDPAIVVGVEEQQ